MAYIPDQMQINAARAYLVAEAAWLRADVHRARTQFRYDHGNAARGDLAEAIGVANIKLHDLNEARTSLYLQCAYDPQQVHATVAAVLVPGVQELKERF